MTCYVTVSGRIRSCVKDGERAIIVNKGLAIRGGARLRMKGLKTDTEAGAAAVREITITAVIAALVVAAAAAAAAAAVIATAAPVVP